MSATTTLEQLLGPIKQTLTTTAEHLGPVKHTKPTTAEQLGLMTQVVTTTSKQLSPTKQVVTTTAEQLGPMKHVVTATVKQPIDTEECLKRATEDICKNIHVNKSNYSQIAEVCYFAGQYDSAKIQLEKLFETSLETISCESFQQKVVRLPIGNETVNQLRQLGCYVLYQTGKYKSAADYLQWIIDSDPDRDDVGLLMLLTAHCMNEIGKIQDSNSWMEKAELALKQKDEEDKKKKSKSPDKAAHADSMNHHNNIGGVYHDLCKYEKAIEHYKKALSMCEKLYGETEHSIAPQLYNNIGSAYYDSGNYTEAQKYFDETLAVGEVVYGDAFDKHIVRAACDNNIGKLLNAQGEYKKALEWCETSLDRLKAGGVDYVSEAMVNTNMGHAFLDLHNLKKALSCFKRSLVLRQIAYGKDVDHREIADSYNNIGHAELEIGHYLQLARDTGAQVSYTRARDSYKKALKMVENIWGEIPHKNIAACCSSVGTALRNLGDFRAALDYHNRSLNINKALCVDTDGNRRIANNYDNIAIIHLERLAYSLALDFAKKSLKILETIFVNRPNHPDIAGLHRKIGLIYGEQTHHRLALEHYKKSLEMTRAFYFPNIPYDPKIVDLYQRTIDTHRKLGDYVKAEEIENELRQYERTAEYPH